MLRSAAGIRSNVSGFQAHYLSIYIYIYINIYIYIYVSVCVYRLIYVHVYIMYISISRQAAGRGFEVTNASV